MDWRELGQTVASDMLPIIMVLATAAAGWAVKLVAKRFNIKLSAENEEAITNLLRRGIAAAEEAGSRKLGLGEGKMLGETKSKMVYDWMKEAYPHLSESEVIMRMDAEIARMDGVGATQRAVGGNVQLMTSGRNVGEKHRDWRADEEKREERALEALRSDYDAKMEKALADGGAEALAGHRPLTDEEAAEHRAKSGGSLTDWKAPEKILTKAQSEKARGQSGDGPNDG